MSLAAIKVFFVNSFSYNFFSLFSPRTILFFVSLRHCLFKLLFFLIFCEIKINFMVSIEKVVKGMDGERKILNRNECHKNEWVNGWECSRFYWKSLSLLLSSYTQKYLLIIFDRLPRKRSSLVVWVNFFLKNFLNNFSKKNVPIK